MMVFHAFFWLAIGLGTQLVAAQLLPSCAQDCVGTTRTKCDSTDFYCACTDSKYMPKLSKCIENFCENKEKEQAYLYLTQLCASVGVTLEKGNSQVEHIEVRLAVPRAHLEERQSGGGDFSFTEESTTTEPILATGSATKSAFGSLATNSATNSAFGSPATNSATTTSEPRGGGDEINGGGGSSRKKSSFGMGAKIGVGVAIPLVLGLLAGIILLIRWKKQKKIPQHTAENGGADPSAAQGGQPGTGPHGQPQMMQAPMAPGQPHIAPGPAELSQSAMYIGHEMGTKDGNTTEMPASPVQGYVKPESQGQAPTPPPVYTQPQPQMQAQSPPIPQPYGIQSPPVPAAYAPVQQQPPQQQWTPPPQGQPVPEQQQWSSPPPQQPPQGQWVFVPSPSAEQPQGQPYYPPQQPQYEQPPPPPQELPDRK